MAGPRVPCAPVADDPLPYASADTVLGRGVRYGLLVGGFVGFWAGSFAPLIGNVIGFGVGAVFGLVVALPSRVSLLALRRWIGTRGAARAVTSVLASGWSFAVQSAIVTVPYVGPVLVSGLCALIGLLLGGRLLFGPRPVA